MTPQRPEYNKGAVSDLSSEAGAPGTEPATPEMIDAVASRIARHLASLADGILPIQAEVAAEWIMDEITSSFRLLPVRQE